MVCMILSNNFYNDKQIKNNFHHLDNKSYTEKFLYYEITS